MPLNQPLRVHAYDDLLVLYWRCGTKIGGQINVFLDNTPVARPILGMEFAEQPDYILAAYQQGLKGQKSFSIRIADAEGKTLAEADCDKPRPLPKGLVASWSPETRARLEKVLMIQAPRTFPNLGKATRRKIAATLATAEATAIQGGEGFLYVRVPWLIPASVGLLNVALQAIPPLQAEGFPEHVDALLEGGYLHFVSKRALAQAARGRIWSIEAGEARCLPFMLPEPVQPSVGRDAEGFLGAVAAGYEGNAAILKGFVASILGLTRLNAESRPSAERLQGKVEGIRSGRVVGWAFDSRRPHDPVTLGVSMDGQAVARVEACLPRPDAELRSYGNCGFVWQPDGRLLNGEPRQFRFRCLDSGEELDGSPVDVGGGHWDGHFHLDDAGRLVGWVRERSAFPQPPRISILIDGVLHAEVAANRPGSSQDDGRYGFRKELPDKVFDTKAHWVEVELSDSMGLRQRFSNGISLQATYRGHIETTGIERVAGWIINTLAPNRPVPLELWINGARIALVKADQVRSDIAEQQPGARCGFEFKILPNAWEAASLCLDLRLAGTDVQVFGPSILYTPYDTALRALMSLAEVLNDDERWKSLSGGLACNVDVTTWVRSQIISNVLAELRKSKRIPNKIDLHLASLVKLPQRASRDGTIDVIVPVYLGREESLRCISSVLESQGRVPMELVVINDASPDLELSAELRRLAVSLRFTLLENKDNLGFVGAVNRGMRLHPGRDVVLLNSDTAVAAGWLDRLRAAAYRAGNIGTATPLSNNATICSFPGFCRENRIPAELTVERLDELFAQSNRGQVVDIPTAVGFCMYIKRDVLEEVGYFDEAQWGKGYGEENDFCMRAAAYGWRHVAACDVFVEHEGGVSFAEGKSEQIQRNLAKLNSLYPDYAGAVRRFIVQDPMASARNRVAKALLREYAPRYMLFVIHGLGGGTQKAADYLAARLAREGVAVLELMSVTAERWQVVCHGLPYSIHYHYPTDWGTMEQDMRDLGVWHIHYHQTMHFPKRIWELPEKLGATYDFTAHDYLPICPRINMIDETGYYCGNAQFSPESCTRCIRMNGLEHDLHEKYAEFGNEVDQWRAVYQQVLHRARRIFAPSEDVARRYRAHFQLTNIRVVPHPEPSHEILPMRKGNPHTVAVIGAIGSHKGQDILLRCVRSAEKEGLPLKFAIIGFTGDDKAFEQYGNVTVFGAYRREDLPRLIEISQARVALFLSPWPETYCFALSEAWQYGLYPVALDIGAIGERIRQAKCGRLLPLMANPRRINRTLMKVLESEIEYTSPVVVGKDVHSVLRDYYDLVDAAEDISVSLAATGVDA
jgi:GT2 family glycosyltransferase/glycosyltransferase involved in cell wall biosynthesis